MNDFTECYGFTLIFQLVSIVLIATASYAKAAAYITSIQIAGGKYTPIIYCSISTGNCTILVLFLWVANVVKMTVNSPDSEAVEYEEPLAMTAVLV